LMCFKTKLYFKAEKHKTRQMWPCP